MSSKSLVPIPFEENIVLKHLKPVVDDSFICDIPLVEVTICKIKDKTHTSRLIKELNEKLPIPSLQHLKRVYKYEIILYVSTEKDQINMGNLNTTGLDLDSLRQIKVPFALPKTKKQYLKAASLWPCGFHEDKYLERLLSNMLFTTIELQELCGWMREAIKGAKRSKKPVGAVVVDPLKKTILAIATDDRSTHPVKHAVMVAIDLVARTQGGGLWSIRDGDFVLNENVRKFEVTHTKRNLEGIPKPIGPYLCTGYDVFVTREPCTMCAMALVHSRARRVFYGCDSSTGALSTLVKLHTLKGLNHRFEVFKNLLVNECLNL